MNNSIIKNWLLQNNKLVKTIPINKGGLLKWGYIIYFMNEPVGGGTEIYRSYNSLYETLTFFDTEDEAQEAGNQEALKLIK